MSISTPYDKTHLKSEFRHELREIRLGLVDTGQLQLNVRRLVVDALEAVNLFEKCYDTFEQLLIVVTV